MDLNERLSIKLEERKKLQLYRQLKTIKGSNLIDFTSNDYLGLAASSQLHQQIIELDKKHGFFNGSGGSRLLSGNHEYTEFAEKYLSEYFKAEACLIFNAGYNANLAILSSIPQRGDTIIYDELSHASIKDGIRLNLAHKYPFKHNSLSDLQKKLEKATENKGQVFVVVESVYSMDGDECPLKQIILLSKKYKAEVILDEAHTTGLRGHLGNGLSNELNEQKNVFAHIYTFGKAMGIHGAAITGSTNLKNYLINFARPFIYTTAPASHSISTVVGAFQFLKNNYVIKSQLDKNIQFFCQLVKESHLKFKASTNSHPIQTILISGNEQARNAALLLQNNGFDVRPILSPTVKTGEERLRICLHAFNNESQIESLVNNLQLL